MATYTRAREHNNWQRSPFNVSLIRFNIVHFIYILVIDLHRTLSRLSPSPLPFYPPAPNSQLLFSHPFSPFLSLSFTPSLYYCLLFLTFSCLFLILSLSLFHALSVFLLPLSHFHIYFSFSLTLTLTIILHLSLIFFPVFLPLSHSHISSTLFSFISPFSLFLS